MTCDWPQMLRHTNTNISRQGVALTQTLEQFITERVIVPVKVVEAPDDQRWRLNGTGTVPSCMQQI